MGVKKSEAVNVDYCSLAEVRVKAQLQRNAGSKEFLVRYERLSAV